jgi:hypothetical protein
MYAEMLVKVLKTTYRDIENLVTCITSEADYPKAGAGPLDGFALWFSVIN